MAQDKKTPSEVDTDGADTRMKLGDFYSLGFIVTGAEFTLDVADVEKGVPYSRKIEMARVNDKGTLVTVYEKTIGGGPYNFSYLIEDSGFYHLRISAVEPDKICYQCDRATTYLFDDGRCGNCTRLTPDQVRGDAPLN